jgi:Cof subfamily protein (haloacid dehalogenase superfamily)
MNMDYQAIIFDLDGTAIPNMEGGLPSEVVIDTIKRFKNEIHLCAATGRSWPVAKAIIEKLELKDPCIVSGGALIVDPINKSILWEERIDQDSIAAINKTLAKVSFRIIFSDGLQTFRFNNIVKANIDRPINTIYIMNVPSPHALQIANSLINIPGITVTKAHSWVIPDGFDLHITNKEATKEHAVMELCEMLKIDRDKVAGVGDGYNDIHLFNAVGHKVAMGNAVPELKEAADIVIGSVEEEGLATFIEEAARK